MTVQEAKIEKTIHALLTWDIGANINYTWQEMLEHRKTAIEALKKQIPKKPIKKQPKHGDVMETNYYCPICDEYLREGFDEYCPTCGQAVNWEEGGTSD